MKVIILGGGLTGLFAAYELKKNNIDYLLIEKEDKVGGLCKSIKINGFTFDYTGHFLHFPDKNFRVKQIVQNLLKNNLLKIKRNAKIYTKYTYLEDKLIPYPFQANIKFLLPHVRKECLSDLIYSALSNTNSPGNFLEWLKSNFGYSITKYFFLPYNSKLWKTDLKNITVSWVSRFVPIANIEEIISEIITQQDIQNRTYGYNVYFYYPRYGGIQSLIEEIYSFLDKEKIITSAKVTGINLKNKKIGFIQNNSHYTFSYDKLISTIPIKELFYILNAPEKLKKDTEKLECSSVICFNLALKKNYIKKIHWIYFPDKEIIFYRVGFYHNITRNLVPNENFSSLYVEISTKNIKKISAQTIYKQLIESLLKTRLIKSTKDILFYNILEIPYAYVIYNNYREKVLPVLQKFLSNYDIYSIGRYGAWEYSYMTENIQDAIDTVNAIAKK